MTYDFKKFKEHLKGAEDWLKKEFSSLRTGIATPAVLDTVSVEAYGSRMSINQLASIAVEDARVLRISPYDASVGKDIEKAVTASNLGLSVITDDKGLRIFFPELTGERRAGLVKTAKEKLEDAKKNVRAHREEALKDIDAREKEGGMSEDEKFRFKNDLQKLVDEANKNLEALFEKKEKEINA